MDTDGHVPCDLTGQRKLIRPGSHRRPVSRHSSKLDPSGTREELRRPHCDVFRNMSRDSSSEVVLPTCNRRRLWDVFERFSFIAIAPEALNDGERHHVRGDIGAMMRWTPQRSRFYSDSISAHTTGEPVRNISENSDIYFDGRRTVDGQWPLSGPRQYHREGVMCRNDSGSQLSQRLDPFPRG